MGLLEWNVALSLPWPPIVVSLHFFEIIHVSDQSVNVWAIFMIQILLGNEQVCFKKFLKKRKECQEIEPMNNEHS